MALDLGEFSLSDFDLPDVDYSLSSDGGAGFQAPSNFNFDLPSYDFDVPSYDFDSSDYLGGGLDYSLGGDDINWDDLYSLGGGQGGSFDGIQLDDILNPTWVNLSKMGGGTGLTFDMPAQYYSEGTQDALGNIIGGKEIPMTEGVLTELGMIPTDGASLALGDPNSFINNPNITGDRVVVSPDNLVTSGNAYRYDNQPTPLTGGAPTFGTNQGLTINTGAGGTPVKPDDNKPIVEKIKDLLGGGGGPGGGAAPQQNNWMQMLMMLLLMSQLGKGGGSSSSANTVIPQLTATRTLNPAIPQQMAGRRPGSAPLQYFQQPAGVQYAAEGGVMGGGIADLGSYAAGGKGRLVAGNGDGVSDDIPATIEGQQPARIARGEYVIPARVVAELGNGSTDAGAERLDDMVSRIESSGRKAARGADSKAYKHLPT